MPKAANPNPKKYLTSAQLRERYGGRSAMWLTRIMQSDVKFPRPIVIGRYRFWALDEIERFERDVAARRVPEVAPMTPQDAGSQQRTGAQ